MTQSPPNTPTPIMTNESNTFAYDTMTRRVPETIRNIQEVNPDAPDSTHQLLEQLSHDITNDAPITPLPLHAPDYDTWAEALSIYKGDTWLNTVWFFAETYFYRQIMECFDWWGNRLDPFKPFKEAEYAGDAHWDLLDSALGIEGDKNELLSRAIEGALWGNRIDLSFADSLQRGTSAKSEDLLVDDVYKAVTCLTQSNPQPVHVIADNAGSELTMDLILIDRILRFTESPVMLHLKMHPTFVSDATTDDIWAFLDLLKARGGDYVAFAERLESAITSRRLRLVPNLFWNSSRFLWEMPSQLYRVFEDAKLVVIKGDANYRRMVGDAVWDADTPFSDVTSYFPAPLLALRTLKSDPVVGLPSGLDIELDSVDARWRLNGQRGVIQLKA